VNYAAEHVSLAVLETLIHSGRRGMPERAITQIDIPDDISMEQAPWMEMPDSQQYGSAWLKEMRTAVLRVPSIAVHRMESNFVLNPRHAEFIRVQHLKPERFAFDRRLFDAAGLF
jgi:RES domain-containing protein